MARLLNFVAIAALIGSAVYAYSVKYQTIFARRADRQTEARDQGRRTRSRSSAARRMGASDRARARPGARRQIPRPAAGGAAPDRQGRRLCRNAPRRPTRSATSSTRSACWPNRPTRRRDRRRRPRRPRAKMRTEAAHAEALIPLKNAAGAGRRPRRAASRRAQGVFRQAVLHAISTKAPAA